MKWLIDQLLGARGRQTAVACYLRENGPIAYELPLFADSPRDRIAAIFDTGLSWYWTTDRAGSAQEPVDWIELTRWSVPTLLADLDGSKRTGSTLIAGVEPQDSRPELARDIVVWARRFATDVRSPLHVLVHHAPNQPDHVFVAQQPPENVLTLLQAWGIDRTRAVRRAYPRLRERSLETLIEKLRR